jgi:hypothetical protein
MRTREEILSAYGVPDFRGATAIGRRIQISCASGRQTCLPRLDAQRLAAELLLAGAARDSEEIADALSEQP